MQLDQRPRQRQAEAGALDGPADVGVELRERREHLRNVLGIDAEPGVDDLDHEGAVRLQLRAHGDVPLSRREFRGVRQQVDQHLLELEVVGAERRQAAGYLAEEADRLLFHLAADHPGAGFRRAREVELLLVQVELAGFYFREI